MFTLVLLFLASVWAGAQNALAGGGSFITFPALLLAGLDVRAANVTSTVALFPSQAVAGWANRRLATGTHAAGLRALCLTSLLGGAAGAGLLLVTPSAFFAGMVPWLVLFATAVFAWGSFGRRTGRGPGLSPRAALAVQAAMSVYGGYFGGGIGFLVLAALAVAGMGTREAAATKNLLVTVINAAAVLVFALSPDVHWLPAACVFAGSVGGALGGAWLLRLVPERRLRGLVVAVGVALTVGLFVRQG